MLAEAVVKPPGGFWLWERTRKTYHMLYPKGNRIHDMDILRLGLGLVQ